MFRNSAKLIKAALITERAQFSDLVSMELDYLLVRKITGSKHMTFWPHEIYYEIRRNIW